MKSCHRHRCWFFFCSFYLFLSRGWVWPLTGITDYIRSTLLSYHIIYVYHYFIQYPYRIDGAVFYSLEISFQCNGSISLLPCFIFFLTSICFFLIDECYKSLGSLMTEKVLLWEIILSRYIIIFVWTLSARLCNVTLSSSFIPVQLRHITVIMVYCCFLSSFVA